MSLPKEEKWAFEPSSKLPRSPSGRLLVSSSTELKLDATAQQLSTSSDVRPSFLASDKTESSTKLMTKPPLASSLRSSRISNIASVDRNSNDGSAVLSSNAHLQMRSHRSSTASTALSTSSLQQQQQSSATFFVMVTGNIESVISSTSSLNDQCYCRYSFSYGPDWEVVHGVSMGLSQIGRRGITRCHNSNDNSSSVIVWNFPIEISFQSTNPHGWPRLVVSVYGLDFMGRDVVRGYASILLPIKPGPHTLYMKTYRPVSGSKFVQGLNWIMGTLPEYYDSRMVAKGDGRAVTRVVCGDRTVKVNLMVTIKDLSTYGYSPSSSV